MSHQQQHLAILAAIAGDQAGAVSRADCLTTHMTNAQIKWLLSSGRWQSPFPRVYVTFSGPLPMLTRFYSALLYAGAGAALSHASAGALSRLCHAPEEIHVTVPYPRQVDPQPGLVVHRSRSLTESDIHPSLSPRRTRVEHTVLDLLADKRCADAAIGLVADAIRGRLTTPDRLREAIAHHPRTRWARVIHEVLPDLSAGAHSALEVRDAKLRRQHGLPAGERQFKRLSDGTEWLDVLVLEHRLHIELDGRLGHDRAREIRRDMRRDNRSSFRKVCEL